MQVRVVPRLASKCPGKVRIPLGSQNVERGERLPRTRACVYGGAQVSGDGRRVHGALRGIGRVPTAVGSEYRKTDCERVGVSRCGGGRSAMGGGSVGSGGYGTTRARRARVRQRTSLLLLSLVLVWGACGSDSPANTGTGGASATGGGAGTQSGSGGATGGASAGRGGAAGDAPGGRGGGGGAQTATCPTVPPQSGTNCTIGLDCYYEDCAGVGVTNATCVAGVSAPRWVVTTSACTTVVCPNPSTMMCPAGQSASFARAAPSPPSASATAAEHPQSRATASSRAAATARCLERR